jgi:hypothetical protein
MKNGADSGNAHDGIGQAPESPASANLRVFKASLQGELKNPLSWATGNNVGINIFCFGEDEIQA